MTREKIMWEIAEACMRPKAAWPGDKLLCPEGTLTFQDNGAKVLAIAHLDFVGEERNPPAAHGAWPYIFHPSLDDRLGAWAISKLSDAGAPIDILWTDNEEIGQSTVEWFDPPRDYNWVFSMDRAGTDYVLYKYERAKHWRKALRKRLGRPGLGSFSCIDWFAGGCCGINMGVGYYAHNGPHCWADLRDTLAQMKSMAELLNELHDRHFPYQERWQRKASKVNGTARALSSWEGKYPRLNARDIDSAYLEYWDDDEYGTDYRVIDKRNL